MWFQVGNEFLQVKIKELNGEDNVEMFAIAVRGGKMFAAEQKIRVLKTRISKLNAQKLKISPTKIIEASTANMNLKKGVKYGLLAEEIERRALSNERFKTVFNMNRIEKNQGLHRRLDDYDSKKKNSGKTFLLVQKYFCLLKE